MNEIEQKLARQVQSKYYGKYRGFVSDNSDPDQLGRLKVTVPSILGDTITGWALPCLPFGGLADQGLFTIPEVDAQVWVEFEEGELSHPIWVGVFWQTSGDAPSEGAVTPPTTRVLKTPSGHILQFDDASGAEQYRLHHPADSEMTIDPQGAITLTDANGANVKLDVSGKPDCDRGCQWQYHDHEHFRNHGAGLERQQNRNGSKRCENNGLRDSHNRRSAGDDWWSGW